jgi:regulator of replication initiation timing
MKTNLDEYKEMMHDVCRALGSEKERLTERIEQLEGFMKMADMTDELLSQIDDLNGENERLSVENERLRQEVQEKDMKLSELSKLSVGVAKKSSQDEVLKALRTYVNVSKRKTLSKRVAVKMMIMELGNAIGLTFPEDMIATQEALDDEQTEPKIAVQGDLVMEKHVENEVNGVAARAVGINIDKI